MADPLREERTSDAPADLARERELIVRQFLKKGVEVTEEILAENRELRARLDRLAADNARLKAQLASDDAIRDLVRRIDVLESERDKLLRTSGELELRRTEHASRQSEIEAELHDLANLYIASSHLHSTLSLRGVVRHVMELLQQLLGAESYALYVCPDGKVAKAAAWQEMDAPPDVPVGEGPIGEAMSTGIAVVGENVRRAGTLAAPLVVVPLSVKGETVGAIVILTTFEQKDRWAAVDRELFTLLGTHAAIALVSAGLFSRAGDVRAAVAQLSALLEELRRDHV